MEEIKTIMQILSPIIIKILIIMAISALVVWYVSKDVEEVEHE